MQVPQLAAAWWVVGDAIGAATLSPATSNVSTTSVFMTSSMLSAVSKMRFMDCSRRCRSRSLGALAGSPLECWPSARRRGGAVSEAWSWLSSLRSRQSVHSVATAAAALCNRLVDLRSHHRNAGRQRGGEEKQRQKLGHDGRPRCFRIYAFQLQFPQLARANGSSRRIVAIIIVALTAVSRIRLMDYILRCTAPELDLRPEPRPARRRSVQRRAKAASEA